MAFQTYSFTDVHASLNGPGGLIPLGSGAGNSDEGITIEYAEDKDRMVIGADGSAMHSLIASNAGRISIRLLKTSPFNSALEQMYQFQKTSALFWAKNVFLLTQPVTGDDYTCTSVAFAKHPSNSYGKEAGILEWDLLAGDVEATLGAGIAVGA